ncbi:MAG: NADH-quinone oxidoreductase subunit C [Bacteroidetes bacterium]|nr:NADH-quinone oxidoreductase subunit C [Bacteroidota bacterium]MBS1649078.1 NADH-quinone oxidoreductase subunit C [Bacteroidota bacterium]
MTNEELKLFLSEKFPSLIIEEGNEWLTYYTEANEWKFLANELRNNTSLQFNFLFCLTCIDWKTHLTMVYHLTSTSLKHTIVIKSKLNKEKPEIETVCDIWRTAEFHEREVYDLFGVQFLNHPDLRRLLLTDDWKGHPLLKDYEDPINMIKL